MDDDISGKFWPLFSIGKTFTFIRFAIFLWIDSLRKDLIFFVDIELDGAERLSSEPEGEEDDFMDFNNGGGNNQVNNSNIAAAAAQGGANAVTNEP